MTGTALTTEQAQQLMPLAGHLGIELAAAAIDEVVGTLAWAPELTTAGGLMHGGAVMTLADSIGAVCAFLNLPEGAGTSTISSNTAFLGGVRAGTVTATARPLHLGQSTIAVEVDLTDESGRRVARTTMTQSVLQPR